jgi:dTDP-glucose 4,6-dehydratase
LLFTSSGAVYGRQPPELSHVPEDYTGAPSTLEVSSGYGQAKRASEFLCVAAGAEANYEVVIARLFAFMGPQLPLDSIFAAGNFVRDALGGGPIFIQGDGAPCRSYLYAADMAVWLWGLLVRGRSGEAYNVGSPDALSILDLARTVARAAGGNCPVRLAGRPDDRGRPARYVPDVGKIGRELGYHVRIDVHEGISRFLEWQTDALADGG